MHVEAAAFNLLYGGAAYFVAVLSQTCTVCYFAGHVHVYVVADCAKPFNTCIPRISRQGRNIRFNYYVTLLSNCVLRVSVLSRSSHT